MSPEVAERFWSKVDKSAGDDGCWLWTAYTNPDGYGQFQLNGQSVKAHRVAYELHTGESPGALQVDHRCHNRRCMNPSHLRLATHAQNQQNLSGAQRNSRSGVRGVRWEAQRKRWRARVRHDDKLYHVGYFKTAAEAEAAAIAKRCEPFEYNDVDRQAVATAEPAQLALWEAS